MQKLEREYFEENVKKYLDFQSGSMYAPGEHSVFRSKGDDRREIRLKRKSYIDKENGELCKVNREASRFWWLMTN